MNGIEASNPLESVVGMLANQVATAFEWLADGVPRSTPVSFFPNPGNVGDAAINLACRRFLSARFDAVEICTPATTPAHTHVFFGGGGNLVEGYYEDIATFLRQLGPQYRTYNFPATIVGFDGLLAQIAPTARIICREPMSYAHVSRFLLPSQVRLGHDAAFALGPSLRERFAARVVQLPKRVGRFFRTDRERVRTDEGGLDVFGQMIGLWSDIVETERALQAAIQFLLGCGVVHTDRLHGALLAGILGRQTILYPNSYFKNEAVFHHSLAQLGSVTFAGSTS